MVYSEEYLKEKLTKELDAAHVVSMTCQIFQTYALLFYLSNRELLQT